MHPAVAFGEEPDPLVVGQELDGRASEAASRFPHPRIVVQQVDDARLAGLGIEHHVPAILVVRRPGGRDDVLAVVGHSGHRPADVPVLSTSGPRLGRGRAAGGRLVGWFVGWFVGGVGGHGRRKASICPHGLARLEVQHAEQTPILRVADVGPPRDVLGVPGLGDVVRHDRRLHADRALGDDDEHVRVVGREHQIRGRLTILELEGRKLALLLLVLGLLLLGLLLLDKVDELLLLVAEEPLAVGQARFGAARSDVGQLRQER